MSPAPVRLAAFVSPHGFGHAARTAAVCQALRELRPELALTLFTSVPRWFFEESLDFRFDYRELVCDVGLVQRSAIEEDLEATLERLETFWAEAKGFQLGEIRKQLRDAGGKGGADAVLCDIAPLGLLAAREAGLPAILVENFTWDWIYEPLARREPRFAPWVERLRGLFALADLRIRAEPVCDTESGAAGNAEAESEAKEESEAEVEGHAPPARPAAVSFFPSMKAFSVSGRPGHAVRIPPIARRPRATPEATRARLGVGAGRPLILASFGGVPWRFEELERWRAARDVDFVVPGGGGREERTDNVLLLPHHSPVFHPDLVAAADVVVGKLGYSTVAEAHAAGARLLYLPRPGFREHSVLEAFVHRHLPAAEVSFEEFGSGRWLARLPDLLARPRPAPESSAGAAAAAREIVARLGW